MLTSKIKAERKYNCNLLFCHPLSGNIIHKKPTKQPAERTNKQKT